MKIHRKYLGSALILAALATVAQGADLPGGANSTTVPADSPAASSAAPRRSPREIVTEISADQKTVNAILGTGNKSLKDPAERAAVTPKLLPLIHRMRGDLNDLVAAVPELTKSIAGSQMQLRSLLSALGERSATDEITAMTASQDPQQAVNGQAHLLLSRFYLTPNSSTAMTAFVDDLEKTDLAHPQNVALTQANIEIGHEIDNPDLRNRVLTIASGMDNMEARSLKEQLTAKKKADEQDAALPKTPFDLSGNLADGTAFSTSRFKGKVVLVDFWATWCGPCKEELPRVKKMYAEYHAQGLEVVGVSNDYDLDALKGFVINMNMPWPELFNPTSAAAHEWNPITADQKIDSIPAMYLIDRKGVLRSVNARGNMEELIPRLLAEPE